MASSGSATSMSFRRGSVTRFPYRTAARSAESAHHRFDFSSDDGFGFVPGAGPFGAAFIFGSFLSVL